MSNPAPDEARPTLRQYFGASRRHPAACVEMSFPLPARRFSLHGLAEPLRNKGFEVDAAAFARELSLPEAIGVLSDAILSKVLHPRWSWGVDDGNGWVCLTYLSSLSAANTMLHCHSVLVGDGSADAIGQLMRAASTWTAPGKMNGLILDTAVAMGLEVLNVSAGGLVFQVGAGSRARHLYELSNDGDSFTGQALARDKLSTIEALQRANLPTTNAVALWRTEDAPGIAARIGYPCVVKPRNRGKGKGVTARITSDRALADAVGHAASRGSFPLVIENHVEGADHRMMVVGMKLLWVYRRDPPFVTGDGVSTIDRLIAAENSAREGAINRGTLFHIVPNEPMARFVEERYGLTLQSVPAGGARIDLSAEANVSRGGTLHDVTARVHPDNQALAVATARLFRMNALGIDFMSPDISRSWKDVPSAIIEVNGSPGISGTGDASLAMRSLFPAILSGRIPSFVVIGDERYGRETGRILSRALTRKKLIVGRCAFEDGPSRRRGQDPLGSIRSRRVETLLVNPGVEALVVTSTAQQIERAGFPLGACDVIVTAEAELPPYMTGPAGRHVHGILDDDAAARLVDETIVPFGLELPAGAWPIVEVLGGDPGAVLIRCWRVRALPRSLFGVNQGDSGAGMITQGEIVAKVIRRARSLIQGGAAAGATVEMGDVPQADAWSAPYVDVPVLLAGVSREAALDALATAAAHVNRLIAKQA